MKRRLALDRRPVRPIFQSASKPVGSSAIRRLGFVLPSVIKPFRAGINAFHDQLRPRQTLDPA